MERNFINALYIWLAHKSLIFNNYAIYKINTIKILNFGSG